MTSIKRKSERERDERERESKAAGWLQQAAERPKEARETRSSNAAASVHTAQPKNKNEFFFTRCFLGHTR